jgi:hypothetical protein
MNETKHRRCVQCNTKFIPDPRVGERQVTCGAKDCQRARHAARCSEWHKVNKDIEAGHYRDVVVPFRREQQDYQGRWRWGQKLRKIREQTGQFSGSLLKALRSLVAGAERLKKRAIGAVQTGVLAGDLLARAAAAVQSTISALQQLAASTAELHAVGL